MPWSRMVSSYSQLNFLFRAGWWQWHARHLNHIFSSGKDQCFLGKKQDLNDVYLHFRSSHLGQVAFHIPLVASSLPLGTVCFTGPPGANPRGGNGVCRGGWQTNISSQCWILPAVHLCMCKVGMWLFCVCVHMNVVSEKLILQGMSRLRLQGHPEPLKQKKIEAVQRMEQRL